MAWTKYLLMNGYVEFSLGLRMVTLTCFPGREGGVYSRGRKPTRWPTCPVPVMDPALWRKLEKEGLGVSSVR